MQWAVAYVATAFALLQGIDIVAQRFGWPEQTMRFVIIALSVGLFVTLVLAWYHGERGAQRISGTELVILTLLVSLGGIFLWRFSAGARAPAVTFANTTSPVTIPEKSIAVLPFENLSSDKENAYFADGIQDEILTRLSKIAALKVISRTSTQKYKSAPDNLREVGKQLGVANLLEGSVQKIGASAHINVQLIRVATDEHLWAESYNRKLDDIFAVEGEVATAIADQLNAKLTGSEKESLTIKPTSNPQAYDAYLRGLAFQGRVDGFQTNVVKSIEAFEEAVRLDPQFGLAWAQLVRADGLAYINWDRTPQRRDATRQAVENAVKLTPTLAETILAEGFYASYVERDYETAKHHYETVRQRFPNNAVAAELLGALARRQAKWEDSQRYYRQAIELDPQNVFLLSDASLTDSGMRDVVSARKVLEHARDLSPQNSTVIGMLASTYQMTGDLAQAQALLDGVRSIDADSWYFQVMANNASFLHNYGPSIAMLKALLSKPEQLGNSLGDFHEILADLERHAGQTEAALQTYELARAAFEAALHQQTDNAEFISNLAWVEACLGNESKALDLAHKAIALDPASRNSYTGPSHEETLARIEAHFGDKDHAIAAVQHLLTTPYGPPVLTPVLLRIDPDWDNLRGDPRFEKLCQEKL